MKIIFSILMLMNLSFAADATIEVIKKVDSLPSLAVEDASINYNDTFKMQFFKSLVADLNVISLFNVDRHHRVTHYNNGDVLVENKDMSYVLRYSMMEDDNGALNVVMKLMNTDGELFSKSYIYVCFTCDGLRYK
jgi:TolB protein